MSYITVSREQWAKAKKTLSKIAGYEDGDGGSTIDEESECDMRLLLSSLGWDEVVVR